MLFQDKEYELSLVFSPEDGPKPVKRPIKKINEIEVDEDEREVVDADTEEEEEEQMPEETTEVVRKIKAAPKLSDFKGSKSIRRSGYHTSSSPTDFFKKKYSSEFLQVRTRILVRLNSS